MIVDEKELNEEEFEKLKKDPDIKLVEVSPDQYKTKQRLLG